MSFMVRWSLVVAKLSQGPVRYFSVQSPPPVSSGFLGLLTSFCGHTATAVIGLISALAMSSVALAQAVTDPTKPPPATPAAPSASGQPNASGPAGLTFTAAYTADFLEDVSGGASTGSGYVHLLKLSAAYDGSAVGLDGLTGLVSLADLSGSHFTSNRVDAIQSITASETNFAALRLYEAWVQMDLLGGQGAIKTGFIDLNTTFDVQETAALFLNASHGIGPDLGDTGLNGPSDYPTPSLGATAYYRPADGWTTQIGVFNGAAGDPAHHSAFVAVTLNGVLLIGQVEKRFGDTVRAEAGAWSYTGSFNALEQVGSSGDPRKIRGNGGVYGLVEGRLLPKSGDKDGGLNGWIRAGFANGDINEVENYLGAGLVYTAPFEGREKDEVGIAIARAGLGSRARFVGAQASRRIGDAETNLEATYRYALKDWVNIQPDVQYVLTPGGDKSIRNALVLGLRFAFTYTK